MTRIQNLYPSFSSKLDEKSDVQKKENKPPLSTTLSKYPVSYGEYKTQRGIASLGLSSIGGAIVGMYAKDVFNLTKKNALKVGGVAAGAFFALGVLNRAVGGAHDAYLKKKDEHTLRQINIAKQKVYLDKLA